MFKSRGRPLYEAVKGIGRIAERRHTAISIYANLAATERHWMPEGSDCPYPEVFYSDIHDATTFERYQIIRSLAILFMAITFFASAAFALQSIRLSHAVALSDEIATQVELNRSQLKGLHWELDQLEQHECLVSKSLGIYYEYFTACSSWEMAGQELT